MYGKKTVPVLHSVVKGLKRGRSANSEAPTLDSIEKGEGWCQITLAGLIPSLNGTDGLIREPWWKRKKRLQAMTWRLQVLGIPQFTQKVKVDLTFYHSLLADEDSLAGRFKIIGDSLVALKVLMDDSPKYLSLSKPEQIKSRRKDQCMKIFIKKI